MPQGATPSTSNKEDSSSDKPAEKPTEKPTSEAMEPEEKRPEAEAEVPVAMEEETAAKETQNSTLTKVSWYSFCVCVWGEGVFILSKGLVRVLVMTRYV